MTRRRSVSLSCAAALCILVAVPFLQAQPKPGDRFFVYQVNYTDKDQTVALLRTFHYEVVPQGVVPTDEQNAMPLLIFDLTDSEDPGFVDGAVGKSQLNAAKFDKASNAAPRQRLLIRWDETRPGDLGDLLDLLRGQIDVPAKQILIEAMVVELDTGSLSQLGFAFSGSQDGNTLDFLENPADGTALPLTYQFTRPSAQTFLSFTTTLKALIDDNKGQLLSRPSVLVLDGHQARITIGDKVPYSRLVSAAGKRGPDAARTTLPAGNVITKTAYLDVNLELNIRPRANEDGSEVTMQVETLISTTSGGGTTTADGAVIGPPLVTRAVETNVRVANDTPFVIGGLIRSSEDLNRGGIPYLSRIPLLGGLFRRTNRNSTSTEVIIVIIPHVIPPDDRNFGFTIGRDSDLFDHFDLSLFRNVYRVRTEDVFDLDFIRESDFMRALDRWVEERAFQIYDRATGFQKQTLETTRAEGKATTPGAGIYPPVSRGDRPGLARQLRKMSNESPDLLGAAEAVVAHRVEGASAGANFDLLLDMLEGVTPGEDKLVKRMLLELIQKKRFGVLEQKSFSDFVELGNIRFFPRSPGADTDPQRALLELEGLDKALSRLDRGACESLELSYERRKTSEGLPFDPPEARVTEPAPRLVEDDDLLARLRALNVLASGGRRWAWSGILINRCYPSAGGDSLLRHLKGVLVLKRLLDLNPTLPLTLDGFHVGRDIVFPTREDLESRQHIVDREAAALFYETLDYYYAFERSIRCVLRAPELRDFMAGRAVQEDAYVAPDHPDCPVGPELVETTGTETTGAEMTATGTAAGPGGNE